MAASSFVMLWGCLCLSDHRKYWLKNKAFKYSTEEEVEHVACFHGECFDSCSCFMKRYFDNYSCCVNLTFLSKQEECEWCLLELFKTQKLEHLYLIGIVTIKIAF